MENQRHVIHVDMDSFYTAVECKDNPSLASRPVIVGADPRDGRGRGVVSAASYEARRFGVHSAMPISRAWRLCPTAVFLPVRGGRYREESEIIMGVLQRYAPFIEPISLDEAFLDVTGEGRLFGDAVSIGRKIKEEIKTETSLVASVGVAPNKFLAKIASDLEKPDGFVVVEHGGEIEFLDKLPVGRMWGVGPVTEKELLRINVKTIGDINRLGAERLEEMFGSSGSALWRLSHGIDDRPVTAGIEPKSVSHEVTFLEDTEDGELITSTLLELCEKVGSRLRRHGLRGRTVHLKVRFQSFRTLTRNRTIPEPTDLTEEIFGAVKMMLGKISLEDKPVRLLGVGLSRFEAEPTDQLELFGEETAQPRERLRKVSRAVDRIRGKYGYDSISRGRIIDRGGRDGSR
jgi:DNA polymerase-4